jgi:hypothetical protein
MILVKTIDVRIDVFDRKCGIDCMYLDDDEDWCVLWRENLQYSRDNDNLSSCRARCQECLDANLRIL